MDMKKHPTAAPALNCHVCGHFGTRKCSLETSPDAACDSFLSWSDLWQREMAAIRRAQHTTYLMAAIIAAVAIIIMILPNLLA